MDVNASLTAPCSAHDLFGFVDDLGMYPAWIDLVHHAEPTWSTVADERVWDVELRARVGPFARSKRLRMWRSVHDPAAHRVVFERREVDGRRHSPWTLTAEVAGTTVGSVLHMHLHYGGALWTGGVLERVLADQITNGRERLLELVQPTL